MPSNPLTQEELNSYAINRVLNPEGYTGLSPYMPAGYFLSTPPGVTGPALWRLFDASFISTGIIDPNRLGTGALGAGNLYLADDGTWKAVSTGGGGGDMYKSTYDVDNDGVVDSAERTEIIVRNSTGVTLTKGQIVYLSGATGNRPNAVLSQAHTEATSSKTIGIVVANIANNSDGYIATNGTLHNLNTSAFTAGDAVWLSATTAGAFTSTVPAEPNHAVFIGYIARAHPTQGRIVLHIQNGYEFDELHGVLLSSPANNDLVVYESSSTLWKNKSISTIFGGTPLVSVPTLAQVTTAGNTTTNAITVGGLTVDTNTLYVDPVNNRVGIGTTTPAYNLQIVDTTSGFPQQLDIKNTTAAARAAFTLTNDAGNSFYMQIAGTSYSATALRNVAAIASQGSTINAFWIATNWETSSGGSVPIKFVTGGYNNTPTMMITAGNTGNVLINSTTDAGYKLDVNGTARVQGLLTATNGSALQITSGSNVTLSGALGGSIVYGYANFVGSTYFSGFAATTSGTSVGLISGVSGKVFLGNSTTVADILISGNKIVFGSNTPSTNASLTTAHSVTAVSALAQGVFFNNTLVAAANNDVLVGLDINPTFTNGAFTGVSNYALRLGNSVGVSTNNAFTLNYIIFNALTANQGISAVFVPNGTPTGYGYNFQFSKSSTVNNNSLLIIGGGSAALGNSANKHVISTSADGTATGQPLVLRVAITSQSWTGVNDHFTIFPTGNVVIQNASSSATDAGYKLDVNGTLRVQGTVTATLANVTTANVVYYNSSTGLMTYGAAPSGGTPTLDTVTTAGNTTTNAITVGGLTVDTDTLVVDSVNNRVGIGTATPSSNLQIGANIAGTAQTKLFSVNDTVTTDYSNAAFFNSNIATTRIGFVLSNSSSTNWVNNFLSVLVTGASHVANNYFTNISGKTNDAGYGMIIGQGSQTTGLLIGTYDAKPVHIGTSNSARLSIFSNGNVAIGTTTDAGQKLQVSGNIFIKGTDSLSSTKVFEVQNGAGASVMDFRNATYAFFGCGQGGGSNSGFIFRYDNTSYVQFTGYNYGAGSGAYKPILMDTDVVGRGQGIFINFGVSTNPPPNSDTEFAVRGRGTLGSTYTARFRDSVNNDVFAIRDDGQLETFGNIGYSGTLSIPGNPPGSNTITITNGLITNIA